MQLCWLPSCPFCRRAAARRNRITRPKSSMELSAGAGGENHEEAQRRRRSTVAAPTIVAVSDITVNEGQAAVFTVRLSGPTPTNASVRLVVTGESATVGTDLSSGLQYSNNGGVTLYADHIRRHRCGGAWYTSFQVRVSTLKDSAVDKIERYHLYVTPISNMGSVQGYAVGTILDVACGNRSAAVTRTRTPRLPQRPRPCLRRAGCRRRRALRASPRSVRLLPDRGR